MTYSRKSPWGSESMLCRDLWRENIRNHKSKKKKKKPRVPRTVLHQNLLPAASETAGGELLSATDSHRQQRTSTSIQNSKIKDPAQGKGHNFTGGQLFQNKKSPVFFLDKNHINMCCSGKNHVIRAYRENTDIWERHTFPHTVLMMIWGWRLDVNDSRRPDSPSGWRWFHRSSSSAWWRPTPRPSGRTECSSSRLLTTSLLSHI